MNQKVYIRADGSSDIGLGHVVRCMSLAYMLTKDFTLHFYALEIPDSLKSEVIQNGWDITVIEKELDFLNELTGDDIVVLDGYKFDSNYQKEVKNKGSKLVYIDDLHEEYFYADLVINHSPGIKESNYDGEPYTKYLLGPDYVLLRPEFLEKPKKNNDPEKIKNLFICFGGSDVKNFTNKILLWLPSENYSVSVVTGDAYTHNEELSEVLKQRDDLNIKLHHSLSAGEMKDELEVTDLAIVPASGLLLEAISRNIPIISGYYFENQKLFYDGFENKQVFIDAENFGHEDFNKALFEAENTNLNELLRNQRKIIDFMSGDRIAGQFKALS